MVWVVQRVNGNQYDVMWVRLANVDPVQRDNY